jgi:predicted choloylglycine hydrolase
LLACSQAVWPGSPPLLARNYDYNPRLCEGVVLKTAWNGRRVIAMSDGMWGALDGINEDGVAVSLSFGGRRSVGAGFGVPLVLRYVLEFCANADEAVDALERMPVHMAYNVTVLDRSGRYFTAYLRPDQSAVILAVPYAANHQEDIEWEQHTRATRSLQREQFLFAQLRGGAASPEQLIASFLHPPLYASAFDKGYGTLYTAAYWPERGSVDYVWPRTTWTLGFDAFEEGARTVSFATV